MDPKIRSSDDAGLRFFGKMSAANAHEIKNALAIINENAGLLSDLVDMAQKGVPFEPIRLKRLADKIMQQVSRADEIAKSTNRFAHSIDKMHGPADLEQSLALVKTMAMRFATQRHIGINIIPYESSITLPVQPFRLLHLLWLCLKCAMEATNAEKTIQVKMVKIENKTVVRLGPLSHLKRTTVLALSDSTEMCALLQLTNSKLEVDPQTGDLVIAFIKQSR